MFFPAPNPARQKLIAKIVIAVLVLGAILVATLATAIPLPLRLLAAATDLLAAAVLWLLLRQKLGR